MVGSDRDLLVGFGQVALLAVVPALAGMLVLHGRTVARALTRVGRRLGVLSPPAPVVFGPTLEKVAASMRRVAGALRAPDVGLSQVRRRGLEMAYDDLLITACRQLELPESLARRTGWDRQIERLRVEASLERAGLRIRPCGGVEDR